MNKSQNFQHKTGVVHGRFQPFHNDPLRFILEGFNKVDMMYVGITNPDPSLTAEDVSDVNRSKDISNPCTYYERKDMIVNSLLENNIERSRFMVVPFPINFPHLWKYYVPEDAIYFLTIYDEWGEEKYQKLISKALKVDVLWRKPEAEKGITASEIRHKIALNEEWKHLVPAATARSIEKFGIDKRIKNLYTG